MKLTTAILVLGMTAGSALAQNPDLIENTRSTMRAVQMKKEMDSNAVLGATQHPSGTVAKSASPAAAQSAPGSSKITAAKTAPSPRPKTVRVKAAPKVQVTAKKAAGKPAHHKKAVVAAKPAPPQGPVAVQDARSGDTKEAKKESKPINLTGRRDPFVSPVVAHSMTGSGCSTGKRCLAIDQVALKGVVRADTGMIAVVVNAVNKAYFLRENDPVFNGYVVKITGDSIIFKETIQDKMGKPFEREVTKKISTPAV
jgi:hypothetical protein